MQKTYDPKSIEAHWAKSWEDQGHFKPSGQGTPYAIALPPPNVTGTLHMGHGFQYALMDALIRHERMKGKNTLWQPGTDHAGIATQMVVERELAKEDRTRHDLGREAFLNRVWAWREHSGGTITQQMRRLGASMDWSRQKFSMDPNITRATYEAFIRLHNDGLIYRGKRLVNWDPKLNTAISDLEVDNKPMPGNLWHFRYPLTDGSGHVVVATTRPETMLGDMAVAVHPDDERYQHLIGKTIRLPLTERDIPIIADDYVDKEFGSGCVKITPAHDFNDNEIGQRHKLPMMNIMTFDACLNDSVPEDYRGLERFAARDKIIADLDALGLLEKIEPHTNNVPHGDRSGVIIEPLLTDQWFVKTEQLAKPAIEAIDNGSLKFVPGNWTKTYLQWMTNIQDWCISRQLWWGHRIPVWYDVDGNAYVGYDTKDVRERHNLSEDITLTQDEDVLDTWFTAALWPFSSLGWPDNTEALKTFYPTDVLVTGFDIIFFWVARMVMMGLYLMEDVPFKEVYITGLIRDSQGQKMSKSKGNTLDPIDLIDGIDLDSLIQKRCSGLMQPKMAKRVEKQTRKEFPEGINAHGTDALRFTFCALATTGRDINFDMGRIEGYRNFCNKIWNAARFVLMNTDETVNAAPATTLADRWIISAFQETIQKVETAFDQYRFDLAAQALYEFTWNQYCDWYLELAKCTLNDTQASDADKQSTQYTLLHILESLLRLMHPLMPYITEEIWQTIAKRLSLTCLNDKNASIMQQTYPQYDASKIDSHTINDIAWLQALITNIRNIRSEIGISPAKKIKLILAKGNAQDKSYLTDCKPYLMTLARLDSIEWIDIESDIPASASSLLDTLEIHIPLAGLIDKDVELKRLNKAIEKCDKERQQSLKKLDNPTFVSKAPEAVVTEEKQRLAQSEATLKKLQAYVLRIAAL